MKNLKLFQPEQKHFGPKDLIGKRKVERPFSPMCPIHLVLKSHKCIFEPSDIELEKKIRHYASRNNIKIYSMALNFDLAHLLIQAPSKKAYLNFIRSITSYISRINKKNNLFPDRPFTRLVHWGRDFERAKEYIKLNQLESLGLTKAEARYELEQTSTM